MELELESQDELFIHADWVFHHLGSVLNWCSNYLIARKDYKVTQYISSIPKQILGEKMESFHEHHFSRQIRNCKLLEKIWKYTILKIPFCFLDLFSRFKKLQIKYMSENSRNNAGKQQTVFQPERLKPASKVLFLVRGDKIVAKLVGNEQKNCLNAFCDLSWKIILRKLHHHKLLQLSLG